MAAPAYRMYHQQGLDDRQPACLNDASDPVRFHPSMPTGWMVTQGALPWSISAKAGERHDVSQPLCLDDNFFNLGVRDAGGTPRPRSHYTPLRPKVYVALGSHAS